MIYFMNTQIWYAAFCTIVDGFYGVLHHLGEIRTQGMLRGRFDNLPATFDVCLNPPSSKHDGKPSSS